MNNDDIFIALDFYFSLKSLEHHWVKDIPTTIDVNGHGVMFSSKKEVTDRLAVLERDLMGAVNIWNFAKLAQGIR